ncbi:hypothetical protein CHH57_02100 [Niallia circulans]|uniref:Uncharacterized protein n=1 Tax=Niallia circulans TaxID=1397 RepID=A0AA91TVY5_NIACI|nr:hypothetical protein [Niallia circulans]PAD84990.1 hypothetical protein CHH57_02100 [Niallia circulans]
MLIAGFFQANSELRNEMSKQFKKKNYNLKEKRFVVDKVLGYCPNFKDMTIAEMELVIDYLINEK